MPTSRTKSSRPSVLKRGFKAEAERKALYYRKELGLKDHDPLPARRLAEYLNIRILTPSDIPGISVELLDTLLNQHKGCWSAAIFIRNDKEYIIYNPTHSANRQESDLMHEIAHAICGHELKELESAIFGCVIPLRKYDHEQEAEAECLGACLQLPKSALFHYHHIKKKTPEQISEVFTASSQMVRYRLSISGVTKIKWRN